MSALGNPVVANPTHSIGAMNPNIRMIATIATGRELRIVLDTYDAT